MINNVLRLILALLLFLLFVNVENPRIITFLRQCTNHYSHNKKPQLLLATGAFR